jgi:hypothetical protein
VSTSPTTAQASSSAIDGSDGSRVVSRASGFSVSVPVPETEGSSSTMPVSRASMVSRNVAYVPTR